MTIAILAVGGFAGLLTIVITFWALLREAKKQPAKKKYFMVQQWS